MSKSLKTLRQEIDDVNSSILELLNKRTELIKEIVDLKDQKGIEYFDAERETEMMEKILGQNSGPLYNELVREIFSTIFSASLKFMGISHQKKLLVSSSSKECFMSVHEMFGLADNELFIIAGPCAVETPEYLEIIAGHLREKNIKFIRAGAYKPRTSPYDFQGLKKKGLEILREVSKRYGLFSVTEVVDTREVDLVAQYADILQIGARNMQNFELLKEVGKTNHPVLLKRGISATIQELIFAAEYIALNGNKKIILCERGIRTYETKTRNTLDISSIPIIKKETQLPIIADLSHSLGRKDIVNNIAKAVLSAGADGIMVEVHPIPELALSDSKQQLNLNEFDDMLDFITRK
ncbi:MULTISPECIES: bifunctional 3-deoxy-7-phosphoheptulonate synthase/chorismate mutase [Acetivibrio]|jgi:3-deoxy-7-phosphoheptulonate synthase/chorismate mutase|uniref:bifunctional 3-deoxy-7-phosphoheptulonate synthase/chorismate mutase n=1 Tax=Acetivibrio TaxID=35829 RepID=UPI00223F121D|nr:MULTISPECIES: bifunctional 3-deoxy-7-phosphoheptulonate synthase/chorismate mutase [Acetivibrio]HOM02665.1 bifunctional 3-deoxy-7-phosphoheptulonate synthase/chorismate mutase [Acetivibrio sp.]HOV25707.1 bifunctional 3-deoxy-7-phosphoheptulonate synthase/chorismate mutase [Pseudobacteroides sp.]